MSLDTARNTPIATGNRSDSLHALVDGRIVELRKGAFFGLSVKIRNLDPKRKDPCCNLRESPSID